MVVAKRAIKNEEHVFEPKRRPEVTGTAHPMELLEAIEDDEAHLKELANQHIASAEQFDLHTMLQIFRLAARFEANPVPFSTPLKGKLMITAFYEPSTRTRLSFESAWHCLGGDVISITDRSTTGIAKGESLSDVAEMFNNYGDCVVLRDHDEQSVTQMMPALRIPIINAGNGTDEHPTQALSDVYTILKWRPGLLRPDTEKIRIGIIGVPKRMRTVRSLLMLLSLISHAIDEVVIIHDGKQAPLYSKGQREALEAAGLKLTESSDLDGTLPRLDVVYINAIAWVKDSFEVMGAELRLTKDSPLKEDAIILHPLARGDELDTSLDDTSHNWYFAQARGAVFLRMALLTSLMQRFERVIDVTQSDPDYTT